MLTEQLRAKDKRGPTRYRISATFRAQHENVRCYIDPVDWVDVLSGQKREIRKFPAGRLLNREMPHPCVFYCERPGEMAESALGIIDEQWIEPLGAITAESLEREGYPDDFAGFRRYFGARYPAGFRPLANVIVQRVRPMEDPERFAAWLWERMYGRFA